MRLATLKDGRLAGVLENALVPLAPALDAAGGNAAALPHNMIALLENESAMTEAARALAFAARPENARLRLILDEALLDAPLRPGKIIGVGRNSARMRPRSAGRSWRRPSSSSSPVPPSAAPARTSRSRGPSPSRIYVSAREFQFDVPLAMTSFAKGLQDFCPIGPWIVTADALGEPWALDIACTLNGEEVQHGNTRELIFSVPALIAYISRFMRLDTGDVIATGTPSGSGHFRKPPRYLKSGDRLDLTVERIGTLRHGIA